jgi:hypothetical protein
MVYRMNKQKLILVCVGALPLVLCALAGCDQPSVAPVSGSPGLSLQFSSTQQTPPPEALVTIVERVRRISGPSSPSGEALRKSLAGFTPNEARIAVLDATRWENEEALFTALSSDTDTLYNYSSVSLGGDLWDNLVALFRGYTGTTYRFGGEYSLPVLFGAGRGVIKVNPGLNMFFASLREGRRTVYLFFSIQMIDPEAENTLIFSPFDILQRLLAHVGMWDPVTGWHDLDGGTNGEVLALEFAAGRLVAGGLFSEAGSVPASNVAAFDTSARRWLPLGSGLSGPVAALTVHQGSLYAISNSRPGVTPQTSGLFRWDGPTWTQIGPPFAGHGNALTSDGTRLYLGGNFAAAGGVTLNNIAAWADTSVAFSSLQGGTNGPVHAIAIGGAGAPLAIVGGSFTALGSVPPQTAANLGIWDTRRWSTVGTGSGGVTGAASSVRALLSLATELYVGGFFSLADGTVANNVVMYNGNTWVPLGGGIDGVVRALASDGLYVYAGGLFRTAEGFEVNNIAVWYGFGWYELGSGLDGPVNAIRTAGSRVFVGGSFLYTK